MFQNSRGVAIDRHCGLRGSAHDEVVDIIEPENHAGVIETLDFLVEAIQWRVHRFQHNADKIRVSFDAFDDFLNAGSIIQQFRRKLRCINGHARHSLQERLNKFSFNHRRPGISLAADIFG